VGGQHHAPAALPPGKTRYPLYRKLRQLWPEINNKTKFACRKLRVTTENLSRYLVFGQIFTFVRPIYEAGVPLTRPGCLVSYLLVREETGFSCCVGLFTSLLYCGINIPYQKNIRAQCNVTRLS
jgi:hypothetical protein